MNVANAKPIRPKNPTTHTTRAARRRRRWSSSSRPPFVDSQPVRSHSNRRSNRRSDSPHQDTHREYDRPPTSSRLATEATGRLANRPSDQLATLTTPLKADLKLVSE